MNPLYFFAFVLLYLFPGIPVSAQELAADGYEISIEEWEVRLSKDIFGETQATYVGLLKVRKNNKRRETYRFFLPEPKGKASFLAITTKKDDIISPRLYFDAEDKTFSCKQGSDEGKEQTLKSNDPKDLVLSGMLIWLKHQQH